MRKNKKMTKTRVRKIRKEISALMLRSWRGSYVRKMNIEDQELQQPPNIFGDDEKVTIADDLELDLVTEEPKQTSKILETDEQGKSTAVESDTVIENVEEIGEHLIIEVESPEDKFHAVSGRRIVDLNYLLEELQNKALHNNLFECKAGNFKLIGEKRVGLLSVFKFECNICREVCLIKSEHDNKNISLNIEATTGIVASGIGYTQFEDMFAAMDIPVFSHNHYTKLQNAVFEKWEETAAESMAAAAEKEKEIAIAEGRVKNGIPEIDVYIDGSWCARSYGTNYKATSGTASIIGRRTGKVLYIGVKNKYCLVCARAQNKGVAANEHKCFKNFEGSSGSMEAEIIREGFKSSISMYGLIYKRFIGDGDASTYSKVLLAQPYKDQNVIVEKIECQNHILRNFCKKMRSLTTETKYLLAHRKTLTDQKQKSMRKAIVRSIEHHSVSSIPKDIAISVLHNDIINSVAHAYGDHKMCHDYNCDKEKVNNNNELKKIQNSTFLFRINSIIFNVAAKSRSLIENVNTNIVECFNNVIAKCIAGKRVNFALRGGYQGRCAAAVVSFNDESAVSSVQKAFSPDDKSDKKSEEVERKRAKKRKYTVEHSTKKKHKRVKTNQKQHDYGPASSAPDFTEEEMERAKDFFLKHLQDLTSDRQAVERSTILQRDSSEWLEIRSNLITASNFGSICKRQISRDTAPLVKNILYKKNLAHVTSIAHGIEHERQAIQQMQDQESISIKPCGLFIDQIYPFIGATPDGLVDDDIVVEVKCPISAVKNGLKQAIEENKIQILKFNKITKTISINTNSNWYYQVQGQLHVTGRQLCLFGIWVGENEPVHIERIKRDENFWLNKMEPKLIKFYMKCLLPEIVNPRHTRGMSLRNITLDDNINNTNNKENLDPVPPLHEQPSNRENIHPIVMTSPSDGSGQQQRSIPFKNF